MNAPLSRLALCALLSVVGFACAPGIGDECETALNCSAQATRQCDRTQPHGYCTIRGCERGTCPDDSVCVKFRPSAERLAVTFCMAKCSEDDDCRNDEGYRCTSAATFGADAGKGVPRREAEILGSEKQRFCSAEPVEPAVPKDEDMQSHDDASTAGDAAASDTDASKDAGVGVDAGDGSDAGSTDRDASAS
jgi:hypothetical protein